MNDIEFIETLKQKRNACDYSQSRLAQELQISRQNLNEIENGKTKASKEMKHILLHYLDYCNCTQPFTLTIDYLRVRFPTTDALEIIKNVLAMKSEYFIHEDYGMFGYEEQYIYGDISVNASKDSSMGVLLELRGMGCRNLEYVLQARGIDWYYFLSSCIDYQGVFKRIDLAVNDMGGLLDIEILRERYYANKVWKRSRTHEAVDSGKLSGTHGDTAKTFYIGSKNSSIYFCLYEKEKEQKSKGIKTDIKNRFEIRLKSGKAEQTIEQLVFSRNPEQTIASLILTQIDFPVYILSNFEYIFCNIGIISFIFRYPLKPESDNTTPNSSLSFAVKSFLSFPSMVIFPPSVEIKPNIALNVVLFPAPFCPIKPVTHPDISSNEQSREKLS